VQPSTASSRSCKLRTYLSLAYEIQETKRIRTTTELTTSWAGAIAGAFGLSPGNKIVEFGIRAVCAYSGAGGVPNL
jgi:hypothetical protein